MQAFKDYVIQEYKDELGDYAACEFKFNHGSFTKVLKKSSTPIKVDTIKVIMKFYDKDMNLLLNKYLVFENNEVGKCIESKLVNINKDELSNKFNAARQDICKVILQEYNNKRNDVNNRIEDLNNYIGVQGIIPDEFKGESIKPVEVEKVKPKKKYEM